MPHRNPHPAIWVRIADLVGSVRFGVTILVLILLWCWIGSAGTAPFGSWFVRQSFEKTEMEWFGWWPFQILLALLIASMGLVTLRKIPLRLPKVGVWTVHAGVIVLCLGSWIYFGRKLEGDMNVDRRQAILHVDGGPRVRLRLQEGSEALVPSPQGPYAVSVSGTNPAYEILSGPDRGQTDYAVMLSVRPPGDAAPFMRQLLAGHPELTEDVLPGRGRAVKALGRPIVDDHLVAALDYAPAVRMHLVDRFALDVRIAGDSTWCEYPLRGLPRYHERLLRPEDAILRSGEAPRRVRPLHLVPAPKSEAPAQPPGVPNLVLRVTGFLPSAYLDETWEPGGSEFHPLIRFTTEIDGRREQHLLVAGEAGPHRASLAQGLDASFVWLDDAAALGKLMHPGRPQITVRAPGALRQVISVADLLETEVTIPGGYSLHARGYEPSWTIAGTGEPSALLLLEVHAPAGDFLRAVFFPQTDRVHDFDSAGNLLPSPVDPSLEIRLEQATAPGLVFAGTPRGLHALLVGDDGQVACQAARAGSDMEFLDGALCVTVDTFTQTSRPARRPVVIPERERDPKAGPARSLLQVELRRAGAPDEQARSIWLEYSHYSEPSRLGYHPQLLEVEGLPPLELCYSRETVRLPEAVALEDFRVEMYPGGRRERSYQSLVRFHDGDQWSAPQAISTNHPTARAGWWFFQSTWDPPEPMAGYAGMNYSGLGVGNRHGVGVLLAGSIMIVLGTAWAFYAKPALARRARRRIASSGSPGTEARLPARATRQQPPGPQPGRDHAFRRRMTRHPRLSAVTALTLLVGGSLLAGSSLAPALAPGEVHGHNVSFASALDLSRLRLVAVQEDGGLKTFDSLARDCLQRVNAKLARRLDPVAWYLELALDPASAESDPVIRLSKPAFRHRLVQGIRALVSETAREGPVAEAELDRIDREGTVSREFLAHPAAQTALAHLQRDLSATGKEVQRVQDAWTLTDGEMLASMLRVIPRSPRASDPWLSFPEAAQAAPDSNASAQIAVAAAVWTDLASAWRLRDPASAQSAIDRLAETLPRVQPSAYPSRTRLAWEHWYHRHDKLTRSWLIYFFALPLLLMAWVYRFRWAGRAGVSLFAIAFALHTLSLGLRWWLAGRIPNSNMFEAITASAWFGGLAAIILEIVLRRRAMRHLPALAASVYAMLALLAGSFLPVLLPGSLDTTIRPVMPVLDRAVWLYIHTNIVIASYALIFLGAVTAILYLALRGLTALRPASRLAALWSGGPIAAMAGPHSVLSGGGASAFAGGTEAGSAEERGLARTLDGATMVFLQLAFLALWIGTVLGAVWADVSWGRPWGWDPKEVFALNTWIVFLVLVHVRLRVREKALWTALLAVAGCAVMLFNWIAVNFVIVGLHSYA